MLDEKDFFKALGNKVKQFRKQKGWSQLNMALELGIHPNELSNIECGRRNITLRTMYKIAAVLGVDFKELFEF